MSLTSFLFWNKALFKIICNNNLLSILRVLPVISGQIEKMLQVQPEELNFHVIFVNNSALAVMAGPIFHLKSDLELWTSPNMTFWGLKFTFLTLKQCRELKNTLLKQISTRIRGSLWKYHFFTFWFCSSRERRLVQCCQIKTFWFEFRIVKRNSFSLCSWCFLY